MMFVKIDDLKVGMRLGKPIYNKNGVLLHERNSKLTMQSIYGVRNFGLIGLYILEPAEPLPPMSNEDIMFERFQTMAVFSIKEDLDLIVEGKSPKTIEWLVNLIIKNYGNLDHKINFIQNLRSSEDYVYKHSLNVAILTALICKKMNVTPEKKKLLVKAAVLHDMGRLMIKSTEFNQSSELDNKQKVLIRKYTSEIVQADYEIDPELKRLILQCQERIVSEGSDSSVKKDRSVDGVRILYVADVYDRKTAMKSYEEPTSEVSAIRELLGDRETYDPAVMEALIGSINVLKEAACVELTNGEKGLVIKDNPKQILRPVVLCFADNSIYDLGNDKTFKYLQIKDVMKTMDNRIKMDPDRLIDYGNNPVIPFGS